MDAMRSVEFRYRSKTYYALIRSRVKDGKKLYFITIMNGDLERMFFGHHVLEERDGILQPNSSEMSREVNELRRCITNALLSN